MTAQHTLIVLCVLGTLLSFGDKEMEIPVIHSDTEELNSVTGHLCTVFGLKELRIRRIF